MYEATMEWLASSGAPNGLLVIALLTQPSTWSRMAVQAARERLGGAVQGDTADGDGGGE